MIAREVSRLILKALILTPVLISRQCSRLIHWILTNGPVNNQSAKFIFLAVGLLIGLGAGRFVFRREPSETPILVQRKVVTPFQPAVMAPADQSSPQLKQALVEAPQTSTAAQLVAAPSQSRSTADLQRETKSKLRRLESSARIDKRYGPLFKQLASLGTDVTKARELLLERDLVGNEILDVAVERGVDLKNLGESKNLNQLVTRARQELTAEMKNLLGDGAVAAIRDYDIRMPERTVFNELRARLSSGPDSPSDAQIEQAIVILYATKNPAGLRQIKGSPGREAVREIPDQAISALSTILSPPQLQKLSEIQMEQKLSLTTNPDGPGIRPPSR